MVHALKDSDTGVTKEELKMASDGSDPFTVPGQGFFVMSFVGPETEHGRATAEDFAIKISGVFSNQEDANRHCEKLWKEDPRFDRYVAPLYQFIPLPPDHSKIEDVHYTDKRLNDIMRKHADNQREARKHFKARKEALMNGWVDPADENADYYTKPDEAPVSHPADHMERLKLENPTLSHKELVAMADAIVQKEIEERKAVLPTEEDVARAMEAGNHFANVAGS